MKNQSNYGLTTADPERFGQTKVKDRFTWADTDRLPEEIGDQKDTNACVSFCMATLFHFEHPHPAGSKDQFSPYFNYFWAKKIENKWRVPTGSRWDDNGTFFWYGFRALESQGICLKHEYNYRDYGTKVYLPSVPPPAQIAADANERRLYFPPIRLQVRNLKDSIRQEISDGKILVAGFRIHENFSKNEGFEKLENGELIWKRRGSGVRYPHAMLIVGFDDNLNAFHVRNSYGPKFGNNGYIWVDYDLLIDQGGDPISTQDNPCCSIVYSYGHVEQTDFLSSSSTVSVDSNRGWVRIIDARGVKNFQKAGSTTRKERDEDVKVGDVIELDRRFTRSIKGRAWVVANDPARDTTSSKIIPFKLKGYERLRLESVRKFGNNEIWGRVEIISR